MAEPEDLNLEQSDSGESLSHSEEVPLDGVIAGKLRSIDAVELGARLDRFQAIKDVDAIAGIYIDPLEEMEAVVVDGQSYRFFGARVLPGKNVNPHFHKKSYEPYYFAAGSGGEMNSGWVVDGEVVWDPPRLVSVGDIETVREGQVHCFRNTGDEPFDFAFACPSEHILDNSPEQRTGDRYLTAGLPNGLPSWHPHAN